MKIFLIIGVMLAVSLLDGMENAPRLYRSNCNLSTNNTKIKHIEDIKYGPMILRVLATYSNVNNYNEPNIKGPSYSLPNALKNFKVKSKEDLNKLDE